MAPIQTKIKREIKDTHEKLNKYNIELSRPVKKLKFGVLLVKNDKKSLKKAESGEVDRISEQEQKKLLSIKVVKVMPNKRKRKLQEDSAEDQTGEE